jgi:hypothetical protein
MRAKTFSFLTVSALLVATISMPSASAAAKVAGRGEAISGCESVTLSLRINDAFLKLPEAQQTQARKDKAITAENIAMSEAQKAFKAAAKLNSKWKTVAEQIDTVLHTDEAGPFTKAFTGLINSCVALRTTINAEKAAAAKAKAKASTSAKATPKPTATKK